MAEDLAHSIVKAAKKMHVNESLQPIVPLYAHVTRKIPNDGQEIEIINTEYVFRLFRDSDIGRVFELIAMSRYVRVKDYEEGIVGIESSNKQKRFHGDKKIIALFQRVD